MTADGHERDASLRDEALAWFVRINSGEADARDRAGHAEWMAASETNRAAYQNLDRLWADLDRVPDPRASPRRAAFVPSRRAVFAGGAMAMVAGATVAVVGLPDAFTADHFTGKGERKTAALEDGSRVDLDADTALALDFSPAARTVRLLRGRASFDVADDAARPFKVLAAEGSVTALGTRFTVHEWAGAATVSVEESSVSVEAPTRSKAVVAAGAHVTFDEKGLGAVRPFDAEAETAWRRGKLIFEDRPLAQVVADVNRYRAGRIEVMDRKLLSMRVSGVFDVGNSDAALEAIRKALPVRVVSLTSYLVLLLPA